jgi:hypothetical protein
MKVDSFRSSKDLRKNRKVSRSRGSQEKISENESRAREAEESGTGWPFRG